MSSSDMGVAFFVLWLLAGLVGVVLLISKGKLRYGLLAWLFLGWELTLFFVVTGPFILLWGLVAKAPARCPMCRKEIDRTALLCPYCRSDLRTPAPATV